MKRQEVLGRTLTVALLVVAVAACNSDRALAPTASTTSVRASVNGSKTDTSVTTFTLRPDRGITKTLNGGHQLFVAANAVCDLKSTYGPTEWDKPCALQRTAFSITARTWVESNGHPRVDFQPKLRFAPSVRANAILYLMDKAAAKDPTFKILYCADGVIMCVDESIADPTVATQYDVNGFLYRRIKHFSGYNIASGFASAAE